MANIRQWLVSLPRYRIYGAKRIDFPTLRDFEARDGAIPYSASENVNGYFQLYCLPLLYESYVDAGKVDNDFRKLFSVKGSWRA